MLECYAFALRYVRAHVYDCYTRHTQFGVFKSSGQDNSPSALKWLNIEKKDLEIEFQTLTSVFLG